MKTIKILSLLMGILIIGQQSHAQRTDVLLTNSQAIEENLYEGVTGSPFYFENWQKGKIYPKSTKDPIQEVLLNYNGYTRSFEIKKGNQYIALDEKWYGKVEIEKESLSLIFETGLLPKRKNKFVKLVYQGNTFYVVQDFQVSLSTREQQQYAKINKIETFNPRHTYYLVQNGKSKLIKLKKKSILNLFPNQKANLESYTKKNHLKLNSEQDLVKVLAYYDEISKPTIFSSTGEERE